MNTRTFAMIFGVVFLIVGVLGFIPGVTPMGGMNMDADTQVKMTSMFGYELKLFPVNVLHDIVHILFGIWGLLAARSLGNARMYFRGVAIIYAVLTVMGLIPALQTTFGLIPLYGKDVWLHALLAIVAAYFGWMNRDAAAPAA
ncbi:MAG TPA: DUF4383 domain-containing protein [Allosphingosinicella sp.]|jgi:hypothetical protein|nr:DUF4383 domain-containing protein [Allosphingosinicella sp.]